jgi:hypothetical protein
MHNLCSELEEQARERAEYLFQCWFKIKITLRYINSADSAEHDTQQRIVLVEWVANWWASSKCVEASPSRPLVRVVCSLYKLYIEYGYMAYIELFANLQEVGLSFHYPKLFVSDDKVFYSEGVEDVRLPGYR